MRKILIAVLISWLILFNSSYAFTIYGIKSVKNFHDNSKFPIYVQMGSFKSFKRARALQKILENQYDCKVSLREDAGYYKVTLGPFNSYKALHFFNKLESDEQDKSSDFKLTSSKNFIKPRGGKWFFSGLVGGQKTGFNSSRTVNNSSGLTAPYNQDIYEGASSGDMSSLLGFYTGYRWNFKSDIIKYLSFGLQYQHFFLASSGGQIIEFSLPEYFTNYSYEWKNSTNLLLVNGKLNFKDLRGFSPYFNFGIGAALNSSQGYTETAYINITPRISPSYQTNNQSNFAYILGAGLDYEFAMNLLISVGYQYSYLGRVSSGYGLGSWAAERLDFGIANSNAFLFGLTYIFPESLKLGI